MSTAEIPTNEQERLYNLYSYQLLDTLPENDYDDITKLASYICNMPVSLVTLIDSDRQWFKSAHGVDVKQTSREYAFCAHAILNPNEMMIVPDMRKDSRFFDNPFVTGEYNVMFYAGIPLVSEEGYPLGSLCVLDSKPNELNESQQQALKMLAKQTMRLIQLNKKTKELFHSQQVMLQINKELENFAQTAAENLKQPCDNAIEFTEMIEEKFSDVLDGDGKQLLSLIKYSCVSIKTTVDDTLERAGRINMLQDNKKLFTFASLMQELKRQLPSLLLSIVPGGETGNDIIYFFHYLLLQIFINIIKASAQFNDNPEPSIEISYRQSRGQYIFTITDNGKGIPVFSRDGKFVILQATGNNTRDNDYTNQLNEVKALITSISGTLDMRFEEEKGTVFIVSVPK